MQPPNLPATENKNTFFLKLSIINAKICIEVVISPTFLTDKYFREKGLLGDGFILKKMIKNRYITQLMMVCIEIRVLCVASTEGHNVQ